MKHLCIDHETYVSILITEPLCIDRKPKMPDHVVSMGPAECIDQWNVFLLIIGHKHETYSLSLVSTLLFLIST